MPEEEKIKKRKKKRGGFNRKMENVESLCGSVFAECFDLRRDEERKVPNVRYMSVDFHHVPRMTGFFDSVDILSLMKRVFGLNVVRNETDVRQKCSFHVLKHCSIPWLLYALFMHVLHLAIFISTVSFGCTYKVSVLDFGLSMMFTLVSVLSMLVTIIWCLKNTARLRKLKTSIAGFDQKFKMLGSNVDNNLIRDFTICEAVVVLLFWTGFFVYYVFWSCDYGTWKCFVNWFVNYHPHKVLLVAFVEEIALLYGLTVRFRCLNEMLLNLEMDVVVDLRIKPRVSSTQRRCFGCVKLVHCRQLHYLLCDLCYDLNDMLSLQTVFNILDCFVNIFVMLYLACFGYTRDAENSGINYDTLGIFLPVFVGGEAFLKIFYLAKYCDSVQSEVYNPIT